MERAAGTDRSLLDELRPPLLRRRQLLPQHRRLPLRLLRLRPGPRPAQLWAFPAQADRAHGGEEGDPVCVRACDLTTSALAGIESCCCISTKGRGEGTRERTKSL
jgi:hypothetical protein